MLYILRIIPEASVYLLKVVPTEVTEDFDNIALLLILEKMSHTAV